MLDCRFRDFAVFTIQLYKKIHCAGAAIQMTHLSNVFVVNQLNNKVCEQQSKVSYVGVLMPVSCCCGLKRPFISFNECPSRFRAIDVVFHGHSETSATQTQRTRQRLFICFLIHEKRARPKHLLYCYAVLVALYQLFVFHFSLAQFLLYYVSSVVLNSYNPM